ncbi:MAG: hypothetical protein WKF89_00100 [Chitinophagaceae bacterium]
MRDTEFDSLTVSLSAVLILILSILYLYEQLNDIKIRFISSSKSFWLVVAFVMYVSLTLFLFIATPHLPEEETESFWRITNIANILKNSLFAVAFIKPPSKDDLV